MPDRKISRRSDPYCTQPKHRGIGLESSILFAQEGALVVLVDINLDAAQRTADIIAKRYPNAKPLALKADVGKEDDIKTVVDRTVQDFGRLDVMVSV